ncbi:MAG: hypothetical protein JWL82_517 [Parcubacteria group bacterium]|nr:hypothetical protein [Parcubacteria group bacterium]
MRSTRKIAPTCYYFVTTVAYSPRTTLIIVSSFLAVAFMVVAVLVSGPLPFHLNTVNASSTHDLLVAYAAKDTDADGLPDWEEALYATDPNNAHSVNASLTDSEAVSQGLVKPKFATATSTPTLDPSELPGVIAGPQTVTDQFAQALFSQYLSQQGGTTPTPEQIASYVESAVTDLTASGATPNAFNQGQIRVSGSGPDALLTYAADAEAVMNKNSSGSDKSEIEYFADAVEKDDAAALAQTKKIGASYAGMAKGFMLISVPKEAATPHLALANAMARLGQDITDMSTLGADPLRAYLGLANYQNDSKALVTALATLNSVYAAEGARVPEGATGSTFFSATQSAAVAVKTSP